MGADILSCTIQSMVRNFNSYRGKVASATGS